jgi:hypothetical protein
MKKSILLFPAVFALLTVGCAKYAVESQPRPDDYYSRENVYIGEQQESSLFASDSNILSDDDIKRILAFNFKAQKTNRIAIMPLGQIRWFGWSDELDKAGVEVQNALVEKLRKNDSVYDASYLPTLLVPGKKEIGYLREAAARYQSDLMLIYNSSFRTYEKYKAFRPDKTKAYCNLEAVLLDTRTGIVPFTIVVTRTFIAEEQKSDMSFYETIRKAELTALGSALSEVGDEVVKFLSENIN